jgi:hypothetical protein
MLKIGSWLIGIGCLFAMAGLCFLPAAFGPHPESTMLSAGAMLLSAGMVLAASGFYLKARYLAQGAPATAKVEKKGARKPCKLCSKQEAVIQCRAHQMQLCADCLGKHFDFRSCAYIPIERPAASKARARSQSTGA